MGNVEELLLRIRGDSKEAQSAVEDIRDRLKDAFEHPLGALKSLGTSLVQDLATPLSIGLTAVAAVGVAMYELTAHATEVGAEIQDLSEKTGMSVEEISNWAVAARVAGSDATTLANAIFMLERRTAEGSDDFKRGLTALTLSYREFKELRPEDQLLEISQRFRALPEHVNKAGIAQDLFGRQGREMLPLLLKPLDELIAKSKELGLGWSTEEAEAAEKLAMKSRLLREEWERLKTTAGQLGIPILSGAMSGLNGLVGLGAKAWQSLRDGVVFSMHPIGNTMQFINEKMTAHVAAVIGATEAHHRLTPAELASEAAAKKLAQAHAVLEPEIKKAAEQLLKAGYSAEETYKILKDGEAITSDQKILIDNLADALKKAAEKEKQHQEALDRVNQSQQVLTATQEAAVKTLLARRVSEGDIAKALSVSEAAVRRVADVERIRLERQKDAIQQANDFKENQLRFAEQTSRGIIDNLKAQMAAEDTADQERRRRTLSQYDFQRSEVTKWVDDEKRKIDYSKGNWIGAVMAIAAAGQEKFQALAAAESVAAMKMAVDAVQLKDTWTSVFSDIPKLIQTGFTGGGGFAGALKAIASDLGGTTMKSLFQSSGFINKIGGPLVDGLGKIFGKGVGVAAAVALPGIGEALGAIAGPLLGKLFGKFFGTAGRDVVKDFAATFNEFDLTTMAFKPGGGFDQLHVKLLELGEAGEKLWVALTQGVGRNNPEQAKAVIDLITKALAEHKNALDASGQAAKDAGTAESEAMKKAKDAVTSLDDQIKSLNDSIANEAPEEEMGVIEQNTRAQIASLQAQREAAAQTLEDLTQQAADSMHDVAEAIRGIPKEIEVKVRMAFEGRHPGAETDEIPSFAGRAMERVTRTGLVLTHPGDYVGVPPVGGLMPGGISAAARASQAGLGGGDIYIQHQTILAGEVVDSRIRKVAKKMAKTGELKNIAESGRTW